MNKLKVTMNGRINITDKKHEIKSQNHVPQIRRKTESSQSMNSPVDRILFLQRTIGNQAVGRLIKSGALQTKLRVGQPGDIYEQEADRVAEQVMRLPDVSEAKDTRIQRKCPKCLRGLLRKDKKDEKLQAKEIRGETPEVTSNMETNINALRGRGEPLSESTRAFFEPRFGTDFSRVRVHSGAAAEQSARDVNANAYTVGHNIVFGAGQFAPGTHEGRRLISHELTHVVQQGEFIRPYRDGTAFNFGKKDNASLIEDSFDKKKDIETKPWIELITVEFTSKKTDADSNNYWVGTASVQYYDNPAKFADFSFAVAGGSVELGRTNKGSFTVHRIEGIGYNSGSFSGTEGVDYKKSDREGPRKRYSKDLEGNMNFAVFYNKGEALHAGPLDYSSHGCVHVDWTDYTNIKQLNYHSVIGLTKVKVKYP